MMSFVQCIFIRNLESKTLHRYRQQMRKNVFIRMIAVMIGRELEF
jgi:hypothetical protein